MKGKQKKKVKMFQLVVGSGACVLSPNVQQEHTGYEQQTHHKYWNRTPVHDGTEPDKLTNTEHTEAIQLLPVCFTAAMIQGYTLIVLWNLNCVWYRQNKQASLFC